MTRRNRRDDLVKCTARDAQQRGFVSVGLCNLGVRGDIKSGAFGHAGSSPAPGIREHRNTLSAVSRLEEVAPLDRPLEWDSPLFLMARAQFEQALPHAGVSPMVVERLSFPERALIMSVPLRRDD